MFSLRKNPAGLHHTESQSADTPKRQLSTKFVEYENTNSEIKPPSTLRISYISESAICAVCFRRAELMRRSRYTHVAPPSGEERPTAYTAALQTLGKTTGNIANARLEQGKLETTVKAELADAGEKKITCMDDWFERYGGHMWPMSSTGLYSCKSFTMVSTHMSI